MTDKMHIRSEYMSDLSKYTNHRLGLLEIRLIDWLADIHRFYPWPALEQSISQDLETVWQEQKRRGAQKGRKS